MPFIHESIGYRLKKHRMNMGYSLREAAEHAGVSPTRLSQWERNIRKPSIESIVKLAVLYRVLIDELCFDLRKESAGILEKRFKKLNDGHKKYIKEAPT